MLRYSLLNKPSKQFRLFRITLFIICIFFFKTGFSQCKFGFDLEKPGPFCPTSDSILLTAWDTAKAEGCVITPGWLVQVQLDNQSQTDNYEDFYSNGVFIVEFNYANSPQVFQNNGLFFVFAGYTNPNDIYSFKFCDKSKNGTFQYRILDRATHTIVKSGTIFGSVGCTEITIPPVQGIARFSGPGVWTMNDGTGYFNPAKADPGTHVIKYYFNNGVGFKDSVTRTVIVRTPPQMTVNNSTIITGCDAVLTATGAQSYLWNNGYNKNPYTVSPNVTTTYSVIGTDQFGCYSSDTAVVTVVPVFVVTVNSLAICEGDTAVLTAKGADNFVWSTGETTPTIKVNPVSTKSYSVTGTMIACVSAASSAVSTVTVNPNPIVAVNNVKICSGVMVSLTATGADTYFWNTGETSPVIQVGPAITAIYTVTGTNLFLCKANASSIVTVQPPVNNPIVIASIHLCEGGTAILSAKENDSITTLYTYNWSGPNGFNSAQQYPVINNIKQGASGSYSVVASFNNCSSQQTLTDVFVFPNPSGFLPADTSVCKDTTFIVSSKGSYLAYLWQDGSVNSSVVISSTGNYWLKVTDNNGCISTDTFHVNNNCPPVLFIPNAFNPSSKGVNKFFEAKAPLGTITKFSMDIYNRWGSLLFQTEDINKGWDGSFNGKNCPKGQYVFLIHYEGFANDHPVKHSKRGSFTLLR